MGLLREEICSEVLLRDGVETLHGGWEENQSKAKELAEICQLFAGFVCFGFFSRQGFSIVFKPVLELALLTRLASNSEI